MEVRESSRNQPVSQPSAVSGGKVHLPKKGKNQKLSQKLSLPRFTPAQEACHLEGGGGEDKESPSQP